jgi:adenylosuccinate synthase
VLSYLDEIPVCTHYEHDGQRIDRFPVTPVLEKCTPVYTTLPGWKTDIREVTRFEDLPENAKAYVRFIEEQINCPIRIVSNGPRRESTMYR